MAAIALEDLRKEFGSGQIVAVDDLSLSVADGEFVTVVGPSGCGKSTTLRMIAGLERPTSGTVSIGGEDVTDVHARDRDVAMVFQNYALYPHKTVAQNMGFGLRMSTDLPKAERRERVRETAAMMGIEDLLDQKPDELSGGQKQRVALGRAIVREPDVFLFDEPLSNLDAKLRTSMRTEIQRLQDDLGITAIYVTHDQEEAMTMGDRIVILKGGRLQQTGSPREVYRNPANAFVGGFVGSPSMNFLDLAVEAGESDAASATLVDDSGRVAYNLSGDRWVDALGDREAVTLGVRPEDVSVADAAGPDTVAATVEVIEPVGADNYLYFDLGEEFVARVDSGTEPAVGERVHLAFDAAALHLFDADTGASLRPDRRAEPATA